MLAPHQVDAADRALELIGDYGGLVLADEAGIGKSFIAAEVMRRWQSRRCGPEHPGIELIVPAALLGQWRETLALFGVEARTFTHDAIPPARFEDVPLLVVVDEAHAFRNPATARYDALARRTAIAAVLLVTATPVCNTAADLHALLRLIAADDALARHGVPTIDFAFESRDADAVGDIVSRLVIRRGRSALPAVLGFGALERRVVRHRLPHVGLDRLRFPMVGEASILRRFLWRRLESSEAALIESLRRQVRFYERALSALASGRSLTRRDYRRAFTHETDAGMYQEVLFWELFAPAVAAFDPRAVREEIGILADLLREVRALPGDKVRMLVEIAASEPEPMLIFTGSAATARSLHDAVSRVRRCGLVTSREGTRETVLEEFRTGRIDVLVSTDMAA